MCTRKMHEDGLWFSLSLSVCGEQIAIVYAYYGIANLRKLSARAHISAGCYLRIERQ